MKRIFEAPEEVSLPPDAVSVFLAGTIDMGYSEDWQNRITEILIQKFENIYVINPRRKDWDSTWSQNIWNKKFNAQVTWELYNIENSDVILVYFAPNSKSPITLAELGIACGKFPQKVIVCCPQMFYRKGNVDIICHRYGVKQIATLDELPNVLIEMNKKLKET